MHKKLTGLLQIKQENKWKCDCCYIYIYIYIYIYTHTHTHTNLIFYNWDEKEFFLFI